MIFPSTERYIFHEIQNVITESLNSAHFGMLASTYFPNISKTVEIVGVIKIKLAMRLAQLLPIFSKDYLSYSLLNEAFQ